MSVAVRVPEERSARVPAEQRGPGLDRDAVRLLVSRGCEVAHHAFGELPRLLRAGDLLVVNTSPTLAAAVDGRIGHARVVVHFSTRGDDGRWAVELRDPDGRGTTRARAGGPAGTEVRLPDGLRLSLEEPVSARGERLWWARAGRSDGGADDAGTPSGGAAGAVRRETGGGGRHGGGHGRDTGPGGQNAGPGGQDTGPGGWAADGGRREAGPGGQNAGPGGRDTRAGGRDGGGHGQDTGTGGQDGGGHGQDTGTGGWAADGGRREDGPGGQNAGPGGRDTRAGGRDADGVGCEADPGRAEADAVGRLMRERGRPIRYSYTDRDQPLAAYQTVFALPTADGSGSAEMPSAARPFTQRMVTELVSRGVRFAPVALHTGVASAEAHEPPYPERFSVPDSSARLLNAARAGDGRVIAVGTTAVRAVESAVDADGVVRARAGWTDLVVTPQRGVRVVDGLLTGLHEPAASHLLMLEAVAGRAALDRGYEAALAGLYLWHEFGDLHLLLRSDTPHTEHCASNYR